MANETKGLNSNGINGSLRRAENGIHYPAFNWQMMTVIVSILVAGAIGITQIGSAQTHISINTDIIKAHNEDIKTLREIMSELRARQVENDRRLAAFDNYIAEMRQRSISTNTELSKLQASQIEQDRRSSGIEQTAKDAAAKDVVTQLANTLRVEFLAEIKRIDGVLNDIKPKR